MTSSEVSPQKKKLSLSRNSKHKSEDEDNNIEPNKRLKLGSNSKIEARKKNFMKACLKVSFDACIDLKKRFQLLYLPECHNDQCIHADKNVKIKQITQSAEQNFKIEMKNQTWYEALEICLICITPDQYLSANVLKDIVEIIMNAHEDLNAEYEIDHILNKCQDTLMLQFDMHPPCPTKGIRDCYKKFLTSAMDPKTDTLSNRKVYLSEEGIVSYCFNRLTYEISVESNDGTLIEKQEVPMEVKGVKRLHWKKENFELFELLERTERIERCMLVLESVIHLLQTDLALWHARRIGTNSQMRSQRPLLSYILWPHNCLTYGTVTRQSEKIMELFAYYIHLQYPKRHIKTMRLWINAVVQMFYMYDTHSGIDYPNTSSYCAVFAREFYRLISPLPNNSISRILENLQPCFMQCLLGINHIQNILKCTENDILCIITWCVKDMSWDNYPIGDEPLMISKKSTFKPHKLMEYLSKKCKSFDVGFEVPENTYPKLELKKKDNQIKQEYLINILYTTFVAYLEAYNIKDFYNILKCYNENKMSDDDPTNYRAYTVSDQFIKKYRSIVQTLQELFQERDFEEPSKIITDLIKEYFS